MMWHLRIMFPFHFFVFKKTVSHLAAESNVEQVFSREGPSKMSWTSTMRCSVSRIEETEQTFSTDPRMFRTRTQMGELDLC
jgi:hypothetical protein